MKERSKVGTFLARAFDVKTDERAFRIGANGEETVGARLEKLVKHGWHVLHSIPVGKGDSDIDHLLIGPGVGGTARDQGERAQHAVPAHRPLRG